MSFHMINEKCVAIDSVIISPVYNKSSKMTMGEKKKKKSDIQKQGVTKQKCNIDKRRWRTF